MSNKQQTGVDVSELAFELYPFSISERNAFINGYNKAKEMEMERMIKLIQFVVSEKELVDYSSVSNDTANYYLDKFNQGGDK
jgi:hypothetical protein